MWSFLKRTFLLMIINILVISTILVVFNTLIHFFEIEWLEANSESLQGMLVLYSIFGFSGAFISLFMSKKIAKWRMKVRILDVNTQNATDRWLVQAVHRLSEMAGLKVMPEVGLYNSPEVNAFATGASKKSSLVAVSTGLLERMSKDEAEGVIGHEVAHIANGDMVTMTLLQGLMNTMALFIASIIAHAVSNMGNNEGRRGGGFMHFMIFQLAYMVISMFGAVVLNYFSRYREFKADEGGAMYAGRKKMIGALKALEKATQLVDKSHPSMTNFKISGGRQKSFLMKLFSTHPPLEERIARLNNGQLI